MKELSKEVREIMKEYIGDNSVAGVTVLAGKDGKEICDCQEGMADIENGRAMKRDTIFRLYSQTKPVTGAAAMILMERGKLDLYQPVAEYLPAFREQKIWRNGRCEALLPGEREMLVVDLLRMTSGLIYGDTTTEPGRMYEHVFEEGKERMHTLEAMTTRNVADALAKCPLLYAPGQGWQYGSSADVLGAIVEVVSKKRLGDFLKDEIFTPLGMNDTDFYVPAEKRDRFAEIYIRGEDGKLAPCDWQHLGLVYKYTKRPEFEIGGAGLVSTVNDYEKFAQMLLNGGKYGDTRILSRKAVDLISHNIITAEQAKTFNWDSCIGYGYGGLMRTLTSPEITTVGSTGEYGWDGWTGNYFCNDPENNLTFMYFIQVCGGNGIRPLRT